MCNIAANGSSFPLAAFNGENLKGLDFRIRDAYETDALNSASINICTNGTQF
jgi:hypothetical protein